MKEKLDANLPMPHFVAPVSNDKTRQIFVFKNQTDADSVPAENFTGLDGCVNQSHQTETFSIANLV